MLELIGVGIILFLRDKGAVLLLDPRLSVFAVPLETEAVTVRSPCTHTALRNGKSSVLVTGDRRIVVCFDGEFALLEQSDVVPTFVGIRKEPVQQVES